MSDAGSEASALRGWLFDVALPLWWQVGADRVRGGFHALRHYHYGDSAFNSPDTRQ